MKRLLFLTCFASPYRVDFFDELGKQADVTVLYYERVEDQTLRSAQWFRQGQRSFREVQLEHNLAAPFGSDLCLDVLGWLRKPFDSIVICGYSSPTCMLAMAYLRKYKIPFSIEVDGCLLREESKARMRFKKRLVSTASSWICPGQYSADVLVHYGADPKYIDFYPFTSLHASDLSKAPPSHEEKLALRQKLNMQQKHIVLSVGRFIPSKGFDVLLQSAASLSEDVGIYIVGGEPTEEYLQQCRALNLKNVFFCGFQKKEDLALYFQAADLFALPTRTDVWGLVINEALAYGLPVVTTTRCVAGLQLIKDGVNGYLVPIDEPGILAEKIQQVLASDFDSMGRAAIESIGEYTIENMAAVHMDILK